jgi:hypothetical protein
MAAVGDTTGEQVVAGALFSCKLEVRSRKKNVGDLQWNNFKGDLIYECRNSRDEGIRENNINSWSSVVQWVEGCSGP